MRFNIGDLVIYTPDKYGRKEFTDKVGKVTGNAGIRNNIQRYVVEFYTEEGEYIGALDSCRETVLSLYSNLPEISPDSLLTLL